MKVAINKGYHVNLVNKHKTPFSEILNWIVFPVITNDFTYICCANSIVINNFTEQEFFYFQSKLSSRTAKTPSHIAQGSLETFFSSFLSSSASIAFSLQFSANSHSSSSSQSQQSTSSLYLFSLSFLGYYFFYY